METPTLYSEIEYAIIMWSNDGTQTAGTLTREIMKLIEVKEKPEDLISLVNHVRKETGMSCTQSIKALKESKEEIGKLCSDWLRTNGSKTSSDNRPNSQKGDVSIG